MFRGLAFGSCPLGSRRFTCSKSLLSMKRLPADEVGAFVVGLERLQLAVAVACECFDLSETGLFEQ